MTLLDALGSRQLVVVTGKGGVGKSAVTAALARALAAAGRRTLALEVDPRENLHQLLDVPPSGGEAVAAGTRLWLQNLKPAEVVDWVVEKQVRLGFLVSRIEKSPIYQRFVEGAPGLREMAILGHAQRLIRGEAKGAPRLDTVVLDAPATGHGLYLLTAPRLFAEAVREGPFAEIAGDVADFVADPQRTAVVVATLAEEMPVQEAVELRQGLVERFGREPALLVVNALYPPLPPALAAADDETALLWRDRRGVNERELRRLDEVWQGARVALPLVAATRDGELAERLATELATGLEELDAQERAGG